MKKSRLKKQITTLSALILIFTLIFIPTSSYAREYLSPAIEMLSENTVFVKNGLKSENVSFSASDFDSALGVSKLSSITILVLPSENEGKLLLGSVPVLENQIIPRSKLSKLNFVPNTEKTESASFVFGCISSGQPRAVTCEMRFSDTLNFAPSASSCEISAYIGVSLSGFLSAVEPDGDSVTFRLVSKPTKGEIKISTDESGAFIYTSDSNASGSDSFSYIITDCFGNSSDEINVSVKLKTAPSINYVDIEDDFRHTALLLADKGIYKGRTIGKYSYFEGEKILAREDFMIMAMAAAGASLPEKESDIVSAFAEISDVDISTESEALSCFGALELASSISPVKLPSDIFSPLEKNSLLTVKNAAKIIYEMINN